MSLKSAAAKGYAKTSKKHSRNLQIRHYLSALATSALNSSACSSKKRKLPPSPGNSGAILFIDCKVLVEPADNIDDLLSSSKNISG